METGPHEFCPNQMTPPIQIFIFILIIMMSTALRSAFGFGNALIAMPLLILLLDIKIATPLVGLIGLITAVLMLLREGRQLELKDAIYLFLASLAGIPVGLYLLISVPEVIVKWILGLVLIGFGLFNLTGINLPKIENPYLSIPFGILSGILGGAYNANGPPVVIYGLMRGWSQEKFRSTLQGYFLMAGIVVAVSQGVVGLWTSQVLRYFLISIPVVFLGVLSGGIIASKIPADRFSQVQYGFLILLGFLLFV
jgi:uncharacterized membrane protein YfcA